jgi:hypothetical protein
MTMQLLVSPAGEVRCVYGEAIDLAALGSLSIRRGSFVEPDSSGRWFADLTINQGPVLGPFSTRTLAIAAEEQWLASHWLTAPTVEIVTP